MASIPSMNKQSVRFRGQTSSEAYNNMQEDVFYDLVELFNATTELEEELTTTNNMLLITNHFQQSRMKELEHRIQALEEEIKTSQTEDNRHVLYSFPENMMIDYKVDESEAAYIDPYHGVCHLPVTGKITSKTYVYDEALDRTILPSSLEATVHPSEEFQQGLHIEENDPLHAVNGNNSLYWHRRVTSSLEYVPKHPITAEYTVSIPTDIISNRFVNMIYLHPFPLNSVQVNKIEYRLDGEWQLLPSWPVDETTNEPTPYAHAGNLKFCIPDTKMSEIKVTLQQDYWVEENHKKVYHFGIQELGVFYADYESRIGKFNAPFTLEKNDKTKTLTSVKPHFFNETVLSDKTEMKSNLFHYHIYAKDNNGEYSYVGDSFPIMLPSDDILIKASIYYDQDASVTPELDYIELTYQEV